MTVSGPGVARAQEDVNQLKVELEAQRQRQAELENKINQLEARQKLKERSLTEKIDQVAAQGSAPEEEQKKEFTIPDILKWASKVGLYGDFRYRYEYIDDDSADDVRHRNRIRARIGLNAKVNDEWDLGFRLATSEGSSGGDPVSTNQTVDSSFSKKPFWLDLAYFNYHPSWLKGFNVTAGKISNPFYTIGKNQLIWDSDLTPEGGALTYALTFNDKTSINLAAGGFWVNEESAGSDTSLWGLQAYLKHQINKPTYILGGASWYDYGNLQGSEGLATEWKGDPNAFFGNTYTGSPRVFASDYDLVELFAEFGTEIAKLPVAVHGDWVKNTVASTGKDTGWLVGARINKVKAPGSWQFDYDYREIQADAVVGQFCDSDFVGGGTAGKGHRFSFTYQLTKNVAPALTYFASEYWGRKGNDDYGRLQADIVVKF
ncbi:MAG: putative porin [Sedimentisphaerales bacterium]|nr:putative porin [Sedimentisphaerales bacterium]